MTDRPPAASGVTAQLSVVVFVKDAVATIERALTSVLEQKGPSVELLVLDGGSTDGTVEIIRRHDSRIAFWRSFPDGGPEQAINEGILRATGDVISLLPADDWFEPGGLAEVVREFANDPELDVLSCGARIVHFEDNGKLVVDMEYLQPADLEFSIHYLIRWCLTNARFIRRRAYRKVGGQNPDLRMSADLDLLIRICLARPKARVLPRLVYNYRRHPASRTIGGQPHMVMAMMRGNIEVALRNLHDPRLTGEERRELRGLHGRSCARLAWMHLCQGEIVYSLRIIWRAISLDPIWPLHVAYWLLKWRGRSLPQGLRGRPSP